MCIQVGHITNKYETDTGREECYEEKLSKTNESRRTVEVELKLDDKGKSF